MIENLIRVNDEQANLSEGSFAHHLNKSPFINSNEIININKKGNLSEYTTDNLSCQTCLEALAYNESGYLSNEIIDDINWINTKYIEIFGFPAISYTVYPHSSCKHQCDACGAVYNINYSGGDYE